MTESAADPATVAGICAQLGSGGYPPVQLIIWDSALSLLSRSVRSENDNVEVSRVYDRLREIVYITNAAGHIVDHVARGSGTLTSRGATAKFNELDVSYGVRLADGDVPNREQPFSVIVTVEKDRYGLLPGRRDREVLFVPTGDGGLHVEVTERDTATHRLSSSNPNTMLVAKIAALDPPPQSANDAAKRLGGNRQAALNAYRAWVSEGGSSGSVLKDRNHGTTTSSAGTGTGSNAGTTRNRRDEDAAPRCNVCEKPNLFHHESIERGTCARCAEVTAA
jgi:hypothetical protein